MDVSDSRILFSCFSRGARGGILSLHFLCCDLDAITSYPLFSPRLFRLDLMIKNDFWFSLDLDLAYLFSSIDSNSIIARNVSILSCCNLDLVSN